MIKVSDICVIGHTEKIEIICPGCQHKNHYFVHPAPSFEVIRTCLDCGSILTFHCEEVKDEGSGP